MPDDFEAALREAWPNEDWTPDRVEAAREAFRIAGEPEEAETPPMGPERGPGAPPKKGIDLALVFGGAPKKASGGKR